MNRQEHLRWCKDRALAYVDAGDNNQAFASLIQDLNLHPDTQGHSASELGMMLLISGHLTTARDMRDFIEGCN